VADLREKMRKFQGEQRARRATLAASAAKCLEKQHGQLELAERILGTVGAVGSGGLKGGGRSPFTRREYLLTCLIRRLSFNASSFLLLGRGEGGEGEGT